MFYRKKPVVIKAVQFLDTGYGNLVSIGSMGLRPKVLYEPLRLEIETLEGTMTASLGDYIIKGVNGEFYPCKPDIFEKTYESLEETKCCEKIKMDNLTFGLAIEALKQGNKVARSGWNGKGMFIYLVKGNRVHEKDLRNECANHIKPLCGEDAAIKINSHIDMKAADDSIVIGWLASQTDMLAEDWCIVE